jgi:16S rRNA G966 N2-methylase RsmD
MEYKYASEHPNFADLASGNVFYSLPGHPAFPIRLASEIYQRCLAWRKDASSPCTIYDPCCGAAYALCVIAYLHWDSVARVICSDVNTKAVQMAERNLSLLTSEGMERRNQEITAMIHLFHKDSHKGSLESLKRMQEHVNVMSAVRTIQTQVFRADATRSTSLRKGLIDASIDLIFTDIPYGQKSQWEQVKVADPVYAMLDSLREFISPTTILALISDKLQKIVHEQYKRLEKFQVGKRQIVILQLIQ